MLPISLGSSRVFLGSLDKLEELVTDSIHISKQLDAALSSPYPQPTVVEFQLKKLKKSLNNVELAIYK